MGGRPKGLLAAPDTGEPLAGRLVRIAREARPDAELALVGSSDAYAALGVRSIEDDPPGVGPLGGLHALLREGQRLGATHVVALACDLPHLGAEMVARVASHAPAALAVAPRIGDVWEPLCARYRVDAATPVVARLLAGRRRSLWSVLDALGDGVARLPLTEEEARTLRDWDAPEDVGFRQEA